MRTKEGHRQERVRGQHSLEGGSVFMTTQERLAGQMTTRIEADVGVGRFTDAKALQLVESECADPFQKTAASGLVVLEQGMENTFQRAAW